VCCSLSSPLDLAVKMPGCHLSAQASGCALCLPQVYYFIFFVSFVFLGFCPACLRTSPARSQRLPCGLQPREGEVGLVGLRGRCLNLTVGRSTTAGSCCEMLEEQLGPGWGSERLVLKAVLCSTQAPRLDRGDAVFGGGPGLALSRGLVDPDWLFQGGWWTRTGSFKGAGGPRLALSRGLVDPDWLFQGGWWTQTGSLKDAGGMWWSRCLCVNTGIPARSEGRKAACRSYRSLPSEAPSVCWLTAISLKKRARAGGAVYNRAGGFSSRLFLGLKQALHERL